jgi:hypothetical protein
MTRIKVRIIKAVNGMKVGDEKNLQPAVASALIKKEIAVEVPTIDGQPIRRPNVVKKVEEVKIETIELTEEPKPKAKRARKKKIEE